MSGETGPTVCAERAERELPQAAFSAIMESEPLFCLALPGEVVVDCGEMIVEDLVCDSEYEMKGSRSDEDAGDDQVEHASDGLDSYDDSGRGESGTTAYPAVACVIGVLAPRAPRAPARTITKHFCTVLCTLQDGGE